MILKTPQIHEFTLSSNLGRDGDSGNVVRCWPVPRQS